MISYIKTTSAAKNVLALLDVIRFIHQKGWAPATSTNFSFRVEEFPDIIFVSRSGVDKSLITAEDFIPLTLEGKALQESLDLPSSEALLHLAIYKSTQNTQAVLHTHSKAATILSIIFNKKKLLELQGFELLKGLNGINTHHAQVTVPIFDNTQNMPELAQKFTQWLENHPSTWGILIEGHGFYTWGNSVADAKKHLEVFEFLFDCLLTLQVYGNS
ncbi:MAG: methylthioribulose 1-phosphate dehydratase [Bacteroidia bacterium]|nr:methylthioribulose 1-phosphate dehydratase [Bacteroidia bacterium]MDW8157408.1 methylthioribulose 1-phosphate dehydratase [Bacteroidia bacterium]